MSGRGLVRGSGYPLFRPCVPCGAGATLHGVTNGWRANTPFPLMRVVSWIRQDAYGAAGSYDRGVVVHHGHDLKAVLRVKRRSLERERHEEDLPAAPPASLVLCCLKQPRSQSLFAPDLLHPELANFEAPAPRVPTDPGSDSICLVSYEDRQPLAVCDACRGRVELVDAILQILNLAWRGLRGDDEFGSRHI